MYLFILLFVEDESEVKEKAKRTYRKIAIRTLKTKEVGKKFNKSLEKRLTTTPDISGRKATKRVAEYSEIVSTPAKLPRIDQLKQDHRISKPPTDVNSETSENEAEAREPTKPARKSVTFSKNLPQRAKATKNLVILKQTTTPTPTKPVQFGNTKDPAKHLPLKKMLLKANNEREALEERERCLTVRVLLNRAIVNKYLKNQENELKKTATSESLSVRRTPRVSTPTIKKQQAMQTAARNISPHQPEQTNQKLPPTVIINEETAINTDSTHQVMLKNKKLMTKAKPVQKSNGNPTKPEKTSLQTKLEGKTDGHHVYRFVQPKNPRTHESLLLDYCCPQLKGPLLSLGPNSQHTILEGPVQELPAYIVMTTKLITREELPNSIRQKVDKANPKNVNVVKQLELPSKQIQDSRMLPQRQLMLQSIKKLDALLLRHTNFKASQNERRLAMESFVSMPGLKQDEISQTVNIFSQYLEKLESFSQVKLKPLTTDLSASASKLVNPAVHTYNKQVLKATAETDKDTNEKRPPIMKTPQISLINSPNNISRSIPLSKQAESKTPGPIIIKSTADVTITPSPLKMAPRPSIANAADKKTEGVTPRAKVSYALSHKRVTVLQNNLNKNTDRETPRLKRCDTLKSVRFEVQNDTDVEECILPDDCMQEKVEVKYEKDDDKTLLT